MYSEIGTLPTLLLMPGFSSIASMFGDIFSKIKHKAIAAVLSKQLAALPAEYRDMILKAVESNPKFFKQIADEIELAKKKGMNEQYATMQVMQKHKDAMQKLFMDAVSGEQK